MAAEFVSARETADCYHHRTIVGKYEREGSERERQRFQLFLDEGRIDLCDTVFDRRVKDVIET